MLTSKVFITSCLWLFEIYADVILHHAFQFAPPLLHSANVSISFNSKKLRLLSHFTLLIAKVRLPFHKYLLSLMSGSFLCHILAVFVGYWY